MLFDESRLVNNRLNRHHVTQATLTKQAVGSLLDKRVGREWRKTVETLTAEE